jgi:hypothetical protein
VVVLGLLTVPARAGITSGSFEGDGTLTPTGTLGVFTQSFTGEVDDSDLGRFDPIEASSGTRREPVVRRPATLLGQENDILLEHPVFQERLGAGVEHVDPPRGHAVDEPPAEPLEVGPVEVAP